METRKTDILILGAGGAGLLAAIHAKRVTPDATVTIAVKGLLGKCGCTRMVQGGYNVALSEGDSVERHFMDTIEGGKWINHQALAWQLVDQAQVRIRELENQYGCFFDRNPDGTVHQKAFAGQSFDRTVHKGDLTGIEIVNRLAEQVWSRDVERMEDHRAVALVPATDGSGIAGVLMIDMRTGGFVLVRARAVLLATGAGPTMYRYHTPSGDKSCDGLAMALRAGLGLRDMEMVQFHPTGLLAGDHTRMTGTVLEEGLRGAGGYLLNGEGRRFMHDYDERGERATRDIVSRALHAEMKAGRASPNGGVYIEMAHLGPDKVRKQFKGMVERCADSGFDLAAGRVEVVPTAHYMMGGVEFTEDCTTAMPGLYAAGEDTGGVHGANRLGGNGVANSTVYGGIAGASMGDAVKGTLRDSHTDADMAAVDAAVEAAVRPFANAGRGKPTSLEPLREQLSMLAWDKVGIVRDGATLQAALSELSDLRETLHAASVDDSGGRAYHMTWHDWLNLDSQLLATQAIASAAFAREDSRGAHYRSDFEATGDLHASRYTRSRLSEDATVTSDTAAVNFTHVSPGESLLGKL